MLAYYVFGIICAILAAVFYWNRQSISHKPIREINLLRSPRALAILALDENNTILAKSVLPSSFFYTSNASMREKAHLRGWVVINTVAVPTQNQIRYMPFSLFDIGLKYAATLYVNNGTRPPNIELLNEIILQYPKRGVIIFGNPDNPVAVFMTPQRQDVRRVMFDLVHHDIRPPHHICLNLPASKIFT